jgi:hypothetical protein
MGAVLICLLALTSMPTAAQDLVPSANQDNAVVIDAMKKLDFMVGNWEGDEKWWMGPGDPTIVKAKAAVTLEGSGRFLVSRFEEKGTPLGDMSGLSVITYDPAEKVYKLWDFTANSQGTLAQGNFEDGVFVVTMDTEGSGLKMKLKFFYKKLSDAEYELRIDASFDEGKTWLKSFLAVFKKVS